MTYAIILTSALLAIALAAALVREPRLRRALEALLKKLITAWRARHAEDSSTPTTVDANTADADTTDRLQQTARRTAD